MRKLFFVALFFLFTFLIPAKVFAQNFQPSIDVYTKAKIVEIVNQGRVINNGITNLYQDLKIKVLDGKDAGKIITLHYGDPETLTSDREVEKGDEIVLLKSTNPNGKTTYSIYDKYRFNNVLLVVVFFFILIIAIAWIKGVGSIVGLLTSLVVVLFFIIPRILAGNDPLLISIIGSLIILFVTTYVAHGISKQTSVALFSTFISLFITALLASIFTGFSKLTGIGNEDLASLQVGVTSVINLKGLFLGGIIIGTLGALNDVTVTQSATIFELARTEPTIKLIHLIRKGFNIGREHILSLVNTLVLAYAGSSLFIFIFIVLNPNHIPYWVILNTETISDEVVGTIVGSSGLILAVPIATLLAAWVAIEVLHKTSTK